MYDLNDEEAQLIIEALESHVYWQLTDPFYRNNGESWEPFSDIPENVEEIKKVDALLQKLCPT